MAKSKTSDGKTKMDMVREAIAALGNEAKSKDIHAHVLSNNGVDMAPTMISSYKTMILGPKRGRKKRGRPAKSEGAPGKAVSAGGLSIADLTAVKAMVSKFGAGKLSDIIQLLSK